MFKHTVTMETYGERMIKPNPSAMITERRITADQILHLCRLLAEQSRTKPFDQRRIDDDSSNSMEIQSEDITSSRSSEQDICDRVNIPQQHPQERILTDNNIAPTITTSSTVTITTINTKQVKKDILNKIRSQIFERKRQKLANVQKRTANSAVVWRPW